MQLFVKRVTSLGLGFRLLLKGFSLLFLGLCCLAPFDLGLLLLVFISPVFHLYASPELSSRDTFFLLQPSWTNSTGQKRSVQTHSRHLCVQRDSAHPISLPVYVSSHSAHFEGLTLFPSPESCLPWSAKDRYCNGVIQTQRNNRCPFIESFLNSQQQAIGGNIGQWADCKE